MSVYRVSYRYANSLMQLAEEKNLYSKIAKDAELIFSALSGSKELRTVLKSPIIKSAEKKNLLSQIFEKKISADSKNFLDFIVDKGREDIVFEIFKEFRNLRDKKEGILRAKIVSATELTAKLKEKVVKKLEQQTLKTVEPTYIIDENIIGGFIAEVNDTVYDASVRHQLKLLRKKFTEEISISNN